MSDETSCCASQECADIVTVLDRHCPPGEPFHLYYPNRAQMPGKLRAFIEFVRALNWEVPA